METEEQPNLIKRLLSKIDVKEVGATFGEIGFGTGLDIATTPLLVSPIPGSRVAYGGINFLGGAGANYVAQQARTEEDLEWYDRDWGEIISSGLLGIIPGMSGKAGKLTPLVGRPNTYRRAATFGAGSGITDQFIRRGIDEGRLPTGEEIATGGLTGSVAGPVFKKSFDEVAKIFTKYQGKSAKEINSLIQPEEGNHFSRHMSILQKGILEANEAGDTTTVRRLLFDYRKAHQEGYSEYKSYDDYIQSTEESIDNLRLSMGIVPPTSSQRGKMQRELINAHLTMGKHHGFDFLKLQSDRRMKSSYRRSKAIDISSTPYSRESFDRIRREDMDWYLSVYGETMEDLGLSPNQIDLDHRVTLVQSLGQYYNVPWGGSLWQDIQLIALNRGYKPGNTRVNLQLADPESHRVKTKFFNDLHGKETGTKYWKGFHRDTGLKRTDIMAKSHTNEKFKGKSYRDMHLEIVEDYYDEVDRGSKILDDALALWDAEGRKDILPDEIIDKLASISLDPKILEYSPTRLKNLIEDILKYDSGFAFNRDIKDWALAFGDVSQNKLKVIEKFSKKDRAFEMILDRAGIYADKNGNTVLGKPLTSTEVKAKYFPKVPKEEADITMKQLGLVIKEVQTNPKIKENLIQLMKARRGTSFGTQPIGPSEFGQDN